MPLAITVALSFVFAAPLNRISHTLYDRLENRLKPLERQTRHPDEQPVSLGDAQILVVGMGRTGCAAYDVVVKRGILVRGIDADPAKVEQQQKNGRNVVYADAEDVGLWHSLDTSLLKAVILAIPEPEGLILTARELRKLGYTGPIVANATHRDIAEKVRNAGADDTYLSMAGAGMGLADLACDRVCESASV